MIKLINWTAKRAGGRITINGVDVETMKPLKVVGVDTIIGGLYTVSADSTLTALGEHPIATDRNGLKYELG